MSIGLTCPPSWMQASYWCSDPLNRMKRSAVFWIAIKGPLVANVRKESFDLGALLRIHRQ